MGNPPPHSQENLLVGIRNVQLPPQKPHVLPDRLHLDYDVIVVEARLAVRVEALPVFVVVPVEARVAHQEVDEVLEVGVTGQR